MSPNRVRPALQFVFFSSTTGPLPDPRRTPSCPPDSNKRSRSAVMIDSRERAHFETPRPGRSAQEKKRSRPHHLARCSNLSSLWAWSHHQEFFWGPSDASISVALHSRGHLKPPGAPEVPMDARKRKDLIAAGGAAGFVDADLRPVVDEEVEGETPMCCRTRSL